MYIIRLMACFHESYIKIFGLRSKQNEKWGYSWLFKDKDNFVEKIGENIWWTDQKKLFNEKTFLLLIFQIQFQVHVINWAMIWEAGSSVTGTICLPWFE